MYCKYDINNYFVHLSLVVLCRQFDFYFFSRNFLITLTCYNQWTNNCAFQRIYIERKLLVRIDIFHTTRWWRSSKGVIKQDTSCCLLVIRCTDARDFYCKFGCFSYCRKNAGIYIFIFLFFNYKGYIHSRLPCCFTKFWQVQIIVTNIDTCVDRKTCHLSCINIRMYFII